MSALHVHFLETLKQVLSNPGLDAVPDAALRTQLKIAHRIIARMLVNEATVPELTSEALKEYLAEVEAAQEFCKRHGIVTDAAARLRALTNAAPTPDFRELLPCVRDLQLQMNEIPGEEARAARRKLVAIEARYSNKLLAALDPWLGPQATVTSSGAVHTRDIDDATFNSFLTKAFADEPGLRLAGYSFISGGHSKFTAKINLTGGRSVPDSVIMRADASGTYGGVSVVDEYRVLQVLHRNGVKVPKPLAVDESGKAFGARMMLVEAMPGEGIGHMFNLPAPNVAVARDVATQLARLHRIPVTEFGDKIDGAQLTNQQMALAWIEQSYTTFKALNRASPVYETAFHWLRENVALNDRARTLVHGDYGLNNILIHQDRVSTILDWEFAHIGNPIYDLGYFYFQAESLGPWREFAAAYEKAGGFVPTQAQLDYAILFAATRLGVMVCQSEAGFEAGALKGAGAAASNTGYHETSIQRIAGVLERVL
ncbi:MAG TPA: phosphotransferase family protein [Steroidobacteraceae bacterium]|nr:phosphotransferase family protein [Steroidobacteraceae bacterium]